MTEAPRGRDGDPKAFRKGAAILSHHLEAPIVARKGDRLVLQKKIVDVRLKYRNQFKPIIGEKKSNEVFNYERDFVEEVKALRNDRLQNKNEGRNNKRSKGLLQ